MEVCGGGEECGGGGLLPVPSHLYTGQPLVAAAPLTAVSWHTWPDAWQGLECMPGMSLTMSGMPGMVACSEMPAY